VIIKAGEYSTRDIVDNPVFGKDYVLRNGALSVALKRIQA